MRRTIWTPTLAWMAAASAALMLALAAPSESNLMGRLPSLTAQRLGSPGSVASGRTLALVGFSRDQRPEINSWIRGLGLDRETEIVWVKMPVLSDPGSEDARLAAERRLQSAHHHSGVRVVPVFASGDDFVRSAGLSGTQHASVLVLDRDGMILARAEGQFDPVKAQALRETLLGTSSPF